MNILVVLNLYIIQTVSALIAVVVTAASNIRTIYGSVGIL